MSSINKISVKVEVTPDDHEDDVEMVESTFTEALELIGCGFDDVTDKFFTMRFDKTNEGGVAATVSAASKRDN